MKPVALILMLMIVQKNFSQSFYLLSGTYTNAEKSEGIYLYTFNSKTGDARFVSSSFTENPSFLALGRDNGHVYAVNELEDGKGAVSSFSFDKAKGRFQYISRQLTHGEDPCYIGIDATNKWVAVANYTGGSFSIFPIQADGSLGAAVQTIQHTGTGPNKDRQEKAHVHSTVFSPDNRYLVVADLGIDELMVYPFNPESTTPVTERPIELHTPAGSGPRHVIFHPSAPFAYLISELSGDIAVYEYGSGKVDTIQTISSHPAGFKGDVASAAIHFSPDGNFLYGSNRGESNTISIFSVDRVSGKLTSLGFQVTGGDHPRDFAIDPTGKFLLVGNMKSGYISIFNRDLNTGLLKDSGKRISVPECTQLLFTEIK